MQDKTRLRPEIFIISLANCEQRREHATEQMQSVGVEFEFFDAIGGENALCEHFDGYCEQTFIRNTGRVASQGEVGCYASHAALWQKCIDMNEPIIIMEDDFQLLAGFHAALAVLSKNIAELGYIRLQSETRAKKRELRAVGDFTLWRYTKFPHSAMCYAITPSAAKALQGTSKVFTAPVDVDVKKFWEHGQPMYGITPYTVTESALSAESNINNRIKVAKSWGMRLERVRTKAAWSLRRRHFNIFH